jgi:hypothetical protein
MSYLRFKIPEITSANATVATFATVSGLPGQSVAAAASVAERRNSDIQTVASVAAVAGHHPSYGIWDAANLHEMYEERAAIMEFDAGMSRAEAEAEAWVDVLATVERPARLKIND